ncbi:class I SAM-dependent methyltransferase [Streptomyces noursei]|uniref:class I SAM-dependent methyltransferase n=1 Tax=Streptomyces noursei TaxID=1971 RepID=UPI00344F76ED
MSDILTAELATLRERQGRDQLDIVETGSIRNDTEPHRVGDGWSTLIFAQHVATHGGAFMAIDLDTTPAARVLAREGVADAAALLTGDSVTMLSTLGRQGRTYDLLLLDSADDPHLILEEFIVAEKIVRPGGTILIDDVAYHHTSYGSKGGAVLPYLRKTGRPFRVLTRWGGGANIDVIAVD